MRRSLPGYAVSRAAPYLATLLLLLVLNFFLPRSLPGDPLRAMQDKANPVDAATLARQRAYYGLDQPLPQQFGHYLVRLVHGDLGTSLQYSEPVTGLIGSRLPWTLLLVAVAFSTAAAAGIAAGIRSAWRRGSATDTSLLTLFLGLQHVPDYVLAYALLLIFAVTLHWFPLAGAQTSFAEMSAFGAGADVIWHLVLPAATLAIGLAGGQYLLMRNSMAAELGRSYLLFGRARGLSPRRLRYRHAARNALLPTVTFMGLQLSFVATGTVFIETIFGYPGLGRLTAEAVRARDYPLIAGTALVFTGAVLLCNLLVDLLYSRLDPRTRPAP